MGRDPEILLKKQQTNLARFGSHPMKNLDIRKKQREVIIAKYGVDNPFKDPAVQAKIKSAIIAKYGVDNPSKNIQIVEKIRQNAVDRFANNKQSILNKRSETNLAKYGVTTNKHRHIPTQSITLMKDIEWLKHQHFELQKPFEQIAEELGCSPTPLLAYFTKQGYTPVRNASSIAERSLQDYVRSFGCEVKTNDRLAISPQEIDILIPEIKLAIEYNGVYWHSELAGKDRHYHLSKTKRCNAQGLTLWHIFDTEWIEKNHIVRSKIAGKFHRHTVISARKCQIRLVNQQEKDQFLGLNHLQGTCNSAVNLGLYYGDQLVMIATFGKARYSRKIEWELLRMSSTIFTTVQGGASKLFKFFVKTYSPNTVVSYADRRWSEGAVYKMLGFELTHCSDPNYFYFKNPGILESRIKYQKHKLAGMFDAVDLTLTEWEIMKANKYNRIWDCGNMVFVWKA